MFDLPDGLISAETNEMRLSLPRCKSVRDAIPASGKEIPLSE
jgi:hypothetical protein